MVQTRSRFLVSLLVLALWSLTAVSCSDTLLPDPAGDSATNAPVSRALSTSGWKGVNLPAVWYYDKSLAAIPAIKSAGFNTVRVVWQTSGSAANLKTVIDTVYNNGMVAMPELHDGTGSDSTAVLTTMVNWWISNKSILTARPAMPFNIANEWGSNNLSDAAWSAAYVTAVKSIRNAGISNPIVIDSAGWGQYYSPIVNYGQTVLAADSKKNIVFSIHMYGYWGSGSNAYSVLNTIKNTKGLSVMVGEFGYNYNSGNNNLGCTLDAASVIAACQSLGVGYLGWSWAGNDSSNAWLDMTSDWTNLNSWGKIVAGTSGSSGSSGSSTSYSFEGSTQSWTGNNVSGGPWTSTEWASSGSSCLKADVTLAASTGYYLALYSDQNLSGKTKITAKVRTATWGSWGSASAKLYVQTGSGWTWYDGGSVSIGSASSGYDLSLSLGSVGNLGTVKCIGVQFWAPASATAGSSAIYVDNVTIQ